MLNVIIPMAGSGKRFTDAGFKTPKPLIDINGKPMFRRALESINIDESEEVFYSFVIRKNHIRKCDIESYVSDLNYQIVELESETEGAACTILHCTDYIEHKESPLLVINSDNILNIEPINEKKIKDTGNLIYCFRDENRTPHWSYVQLDSNHCVVKVEEKNPISDIATAGLYVWNSVNSFKRAVTKMIERDIRTNGEFYLAPVYNENVNSGEKVAIEMVNGMHGVGTPEELYVYLNKWG